MALIVNDNSYLSVIDADTFFDDSIYFVQWDTYTDAEKSRGLISATSTLDNSYVWCGCKTDLTQELEWPKKYILDCDTCCFENYTSSRSSYTSDIYIDSAVVPQEILDATCILALQLLINNPLAIESKDDSKDITKAKLDVMEVNYSIDSKVMQVIPLGARMLINKCFGTLKTAIQKSTCRR